MNPEIVPAWSVVVDGYQDATAALKKKLISLTVSDESGFKSDSATMVIDDSCGKIAMPRKGTRLTVRMGYRDALSNMGTFVVDRVGISGPPDTLTITANGADFRGAFKSLKSRSFDNIRLPDLVGILAADNSYKSNIAAKFAGVLLDHVDQTNESDLNLLSRLASDYDGILKLTGRDLVFSDRRSGASVTGLALSPVSLKLTDLNQWSYDINDQPKYASVSARYHDLTANETKTVTAGAGEPVYTLNHTYPDAARAQAAADSRLKLLSDNTETLSMQLTGDPRLMAETPLTVTGGRPELSRRWLVKRASHTITPAGYSTGVDAIPA